MLNLYIVSSYQKYQLTQFTVQRLEFYLKKIVSVGITHVESIERKKLPLSEPMLLPQAPIPSVFKNKEKYFT